MIPSIATAQVIGYSEENHSVFVTLEASSSGPSYQVKVLERYSDGARIQQNPLPVRGSWGLVLFPYGDDRNGVWIGAFPPALVDAINAVAGDYGEYYESYPSDVYKLIDADANMLVSHPSGTWWAINQNGTKPTVYRHVVDSSTQKQERVAFPDSLRQTQTAPYVKFHHSSGTDIEIDPSGNVTASVTGTLDVTANGATTVTANAGVTINVTGNATMNSTGSVSITSAVSASVTAPSIALSNAGGSPLALMNSNGVTVYNGHTHSGTTSDGAAFTTGAPNQAMTPSVETAVVTGA